MPEIWEKKGKFLCFNNPFFWNSPTKILETLAFVLKEHISKNHEFFNIIIT